MLNVVSFNLGEWLQRPKRKKREKKFEKQQQQQKRRKVPDLIIVGNLPKVLSSLE